MDELNQSFAQKYGFNKPAKTQKNTVKPAAQQSSSSVETFPKTYRITKKQESFIQFMKERAQAHPQQPVRESSVIRALIQLVSADETLQKRVLAEMDKDTIFWGRPPRK